MPLKVNLLGKELCHGGHVFSQHLVLCVKLQSMKLCTFLKTKVGLTIPDKMTMRSFYLPESYMDAIDVIQKKLKYSALRVSMDEITDVKGGYVANIFYGKLDSKSHTAPVTANCVFLERTNVHQPS